MDWSVRGRRIDGQSGGSAEQQSGQQRCTAKCAKRSTTFWLTGLTHVLYIHMNAPDAPRINGVVESVLYVEDLDRAVQFYRDCLGFRSITGDATRFQSFDAGAGQVLLLFKRGGTLVPAVTSGGIIPPHDGSGPHHIGFAIAPEAYAPWKARLTAWAIAIESEATWARGGRSLYFRDPDGHLLELITPGIWENY